MHSDDPLIRKLVATLGEEEILRRRDLVQTLRLMAVDDDFASLVPTMHPWVVYRLRGIAKRAPGHPEDVLLIHARLHRPDISQQELAAIDFRERLHHYWSARRLRELLCPELDPPQFRSIRAAGTVAHSLPPPPVLSPLGKTTGR